MKRLAMFTAAMMLSTPTLAWYCSEDKTVKETLEIGSITDIRVQSGAGELRIEGDGNSDSVAIVAKMCASDKQQLDKMEIKTEVSNDFAEIETRIPKSSSGNYSASIDLYLTVPESANLNVRDSSGDLEIEDVASLILMDSSGGIDLENISGKVDLTDSSGSIDVKNVGSIELTDSSGGIDIRKVADNVLVRVDSSGDIEASDVGGDVLVRVDSSGSIDVQDIGGNFVVEKDGSGAIRYDDVKGEVNIPRRKM